MDDNQQSVLITGANGFVGARLCRFLIDKNFKVIAGVRRSADLSRLKDLNVEYRYGDVTRPDDLPAIVESVDYVIHNAGLVKAKTAQQFYDVNEGGTKNLLEALIQHNLNIKKFIYISSQAAAGPSLDGQPVRETDQPRPMTTYGKSKLAGEKTALSYSDKFNILSVRPPGIYGPGEMEIFSFFQTLHNRIKPYIGNCSRRVQLVHVDDLCRGIYLALTKKTETGQIYFIAENKAYSMKELITILRKVIGKRALPIYIPAPLFKVVALLSEIIFKIFSATPMLTVEKAGELLASWELSVEQAKKDLEFESMIDFSTGAEETYDWYKKEGWL
jgi:nucleoside-diphosphate-sugar epimerase